MMTKQMYTKITQLLLSFFVCIMLQVYAHEQRSISPIKVIVFDFGGVIGQSNRNIIYEGIANTFGIPSKDIKPLLAQLKNHLFMGGDEQFFWENVAKSRGRALPPTWLADFRALLACAIQDIPGTLTLIKSLQQQGFQVALLSNVRKDKAEVLRKLGYYSYFNPVLLSCDLGYAKPDPYIFQILLHTLQVPKEACVFVDNRIENITAAQALGIDSIHFINAPQLNEELARRGIYTK